MIAFRPNLRAQDGMSMVAALVAVAIVAVLAMSMSTAFANLVQVQRIAKIQGQKQDVRTILRGSLSCATACVDIVRDVPPQIGDWALRASCKGAVPFIEIRNPKLPDEGWSPAFKEGTEAAVCAKNIEPLPGGKGAKEGDPASAPGRRQVCPRGERVLSINFIDETIECG